MVVFESAADRITKAGQRPRVALDATAAKLELNRRQLRFYW
jgi:hypothetical protein